MNRQLLKIGVLFFISISFHACHGQVSPASQPDEKVTAAIGKAVEALDSQIWRIFQDSKGMYWFGSNGSGLYRYDGEALIQFTTKDGLAGNQIRGIQEDNQGHLYIETAEGISKWVGRQFIPLKASPSSAQAWKLQPNDLWFGHYGNNLYRYDGTTLFELQLPRQDLKTAFGIDTNRTPNGGNTEGPYAVYGVNKDKDGNIWIGTINAGAYRYDGQGFLWFGEKELSTLPDGRVPGVRAMLQDKDGYYWLSNLYSKYKIDPSQAKGYEQVTLAEVPAAGSTEPLRYFNAGIVDRDGHLWLTTYHGGVWKYDGETLTNYEVKKGTEVALLVTIYQDRNGTIWLGTNNAGLYIFNGKGFEKLEILRQSR